MKKTTHSLLVTALILFCTGLLLALCTSLYAKIAKIEVFEVPKKAKTIESITVSLDEILEKSPESNFVKQLSPVQFTDVELHSFAGDLKICTGGESVELVLDQANTNNLAYAVVGDTLQISEVDAVGFMGFYIDKGGLSFKGLRHMFHPGNAMNSKRTITLMIPENYPISNLDINSSIGDVLIDGINAAVINVESSNGLVDIKNLKNEAAKITIGGSFADVVMKNNLYSSCAISTQFGDVDTHLLENSNTSTILDVWCGDITVKTDLPTSYYKLSISTSSGTVFRNGKDQGNKLNNNGSSACRISSGILLGDFELSYSGKDEDAYVPPTPPAAEQEQAPADQAPADQAQT